MAVGDCNVQYANAPHLLKGAFSVKNFNSHWAIDAAFAGGKAPPVFFVGVIADCKSNLTLATSNLIGWF